MKRQHKANRLDTTLVSKLISADGDGSNISANTISSTDSTLFIKTEDLDGIVQDNNNDAGLLTPPTLVYPFDGLSNVGEKRLTINIPRAYSEIKRGDWRLVYVYLATDDKFTIANTQVFSVVLPPIIGDFTIHYGVPLSENTAYHIKARLSWNNLVSRYTDTAAFTTGSNLAYMSSGGTRVKPPPVTANPVIIVRGGASWGNTNGPYGRTVFSVESNTRDHTLLVSEIVTDDIPVFAYIGERGDSFTISGYASTSTGSELGATIHDVVKMSGLRNAIVPLGDLPSYAKDRTITYSDYTNRLYVSNGHTEVDIASNSSLPLATYTANILEVDPETATVIGTALQINYDTGTPVIHASGTNLFHKPSNDVYLYVKDLTGPLLSASTYSVPGYDSSVTNARIVSRDNGDVYLFGIKAGVLLTWQIYPTPIVTKSTTTLSGLFEVVNMDTLFLVVAHNADGSNFQVLRYLANSDIWQSDSFTPNIDPTKPYRLLTTTTGGVYTIQDNADGSMTLSIYKGPNVAWQDITISSSKRDNIPKIGTGSYTTLADNSVAVLEWQEPGVGLRQNLFYKYYI